MAQTRTREELEAALKVATPRQVRCVQGKLDGLTEAQIAQSMGIAERSVRYHIVNACKKVVWDGHPPRMPVEGVAPVELLSPEIEHQLKAKNKHLASEVRDLTQQLAEANNLINVMGELSSTKAKPIKINRKKGRHQVAATAFLSDTHFDEVVSLEQTGGTNEYNRAIAERRLRTFAEKTILVAKDLLSGFDVIHLDMPMGGDMVSGNIHDELLASNEAEIMDTVDHWSEKIAEVIVTLSGEFPSIFIPCVVGNHGRNTRKPRHKGRVRDNFDWLIYRTVQRILKNSVTNVTMAVSESTDIVWDTLGKKYCLTHGDQASGGQGWGGIYSPIMRLYEKKIKAYSGRGQTFDYLIMGHWHQFTDAGSIIVNGTTKGYDEFAHNLNFRPEPPCQAFWLTDPEHGKIMSGPLLVDD